MKKLTYIAVAGCVFFGLLGSVSATTLTVYPANHPTANVVMNGDECSVSGTSGTTTILPGGSEGCAVTTNSVVIPTSTTKKTAEAAKTEVKKKN